MDLLRSGWFIRSRRNYFQQELMARPATRIRKLSEQSLVMDPKFLAVIHAAGSQNFDTMICRPLGKPRPNVRFLTQRQRENTRLFNWSANPYIIIRCRVER
jgi:hypothetical protein